jgi:GNAT superfamily N-acetyltransferase
VAERARDWHRARQAAVCDVFDPWAHVYVHPECRGRGRGAAMTRAAIAAAAGVRDLWIAADDEDRPKHLYARLGFRPAWTAMEFLRLP